MRTHEVPSFTGQIENLPEISGRPASFTISEGEVATKFKVMFYLSVLRAFKWRRVY
jgi:hypothetical protein